VAARHFERRRESALVAPAFQGAAVGYFGDAKANGKIPWMNNFERHIGEPQFQVALPVGSELLHLAFSDSGVVPRTLMHGTPVSAC
jgi:hypothetical protein